MSENESVNQTTKVSVTQSLGTGKNVYFLPGWWLLGVARSQQVKLFDYDAPKTCLWLWAVASRLLQLPIVHLKDWLVCKQSPFSLRAIKKPELEMENFVFKIQDFSYNCNWHIA